METLSRIGDLTLLTSKVADTCSNLSPVVVGSAFAVILSFTFLLLRWTNWTLSPRRRDDGKLPLPWSWLPTWFTRTIYFQHIPIIPANSIFGFTRGMSFWGDPDSHLVLKKTADRVGPIFQFPFLHHLIVCVSEKTFAKAILKHVHGKGFFHRGDPLINPANSFNMDTDAEWQRRRAIFRAPFAATSVRAFSLSIRQLVLKLCYKLEAVAATGGKVAMDNMFGQLTMDVICKVGFNYDLNALDNSEEFQSLHKALKQSFENSWVSLLPFSGYIAKLPVPLGPIQAHKNSKEIVRTFGKKLLSHIRQLDESGTLDPNCLASAILQFSKLPGITEEDVLAEINLFFIAGHETTAHTLSWIFYALAKDNLVQNEARSSADSFNPVSTLDLLPNYMEAVIKEAMRKYTIVGIGSLRTVQDDEGFKFTIDGKEMTFPKGTWFLVNIHTLHNSVDNWGPTAGIFDPQRWLTQDFQSVTENIEEESKTGCPMHENPLSKVSMYGGGGMKKQELIFAPFSHGPRNCLGMHLALAEIRIAFYELIRRFVFNFEGDEYRDEESVMELHLTLRPKDGLPLLVRHRDENK